MVNNISRFFINRRLKRESKVFSLHSSFNTKALEQRIVALADQLLEKKLVYLKPKSTAAHFEKIGLGILTTELYDAGGHTPCCINFIKSFCSDYRIEFFISRKAKSIKNLNKSKIDSIEYCVAINGSSASRYDFIKNAQDIYNHFILTDVNTIVLFINQNDFAAVLALRWLKRLTAIRVIMFNLADHQPVVGMSQADKILDFREPGVLLTRQQRGYNNNVLVDLQSYAKHDLPEIAPCEVSAQRLEFGVNAEQCLSLTGCNAIKLFETDSSPYFEMIRDILIENPEHKHVVVASFKADHAALIEAIFAKNRQARQRLIIIPPTHKFDLLLQSADFFIDSFPQGSALTHIDCMRNKTATIVKANSQDPFKSFEDYLPKDYPFVAYTVDEMKQQIQQLILDKDCRETTSEMLYDYFLQRFEGGVVKNIYRKIIEENTITN